MNDASQSTGMRAEALLQILEVTRKLAAPFDLDSVLVEIGEAARSVLRAERATIWLHEPESGRLVLTGESSQPPVRAPLDVGILGATARSLAIINVPDCRADPRFDPAVDLDYDNDVRCMLSVPFIEHNSLVGVLQVVDRADGPFTAEDERVAETLAMQCAVFIQRERMTRSLMMAEKLDREIKLAREIQMSTLPSEMPRTPGYDMAGQFCPAAWYCTSWRLVSRMPRNAVTKCSSGRSSTSWLLTWEKTAFKSAPSLRATRSIAVICVELNAGPMP